MKINGKHNNLQMHGIKLDNGNLWKYSVAQCGKEDRSAGFQEWPLTWK